MPKTALIIYDRCDPRQCPGGICSAAGACPRRLLRQEQPYEIPQPDPALCKACGDCVRACGRGAVFIARS